MTIPTHLMAGIVIGKITGDYTLSIVGATFLDLDHVASYAKHGILQKPKRLWQALTDTGDPYGDQRYLFHNFIVFLIISGIILSIDFKIGMIFGFGYLSHIVLDALDDADYYPLFPNKKISIRGPVGYFSRSELLFLTFLIIVFFLV